jgi:hypothetical protein
MNTGTPEWKAMHIPLVSPVEVIMVLNIRRAVCLPVFITKTSFEQTNK